MFALVASSLAGEAKKEKRGLLGLDAGLPLNAGPDGFAAGYPTYAANFQAQPIYNEAPHFAQQGFAHQGFAQQGLGHAQLVAAPLAVAPAHTHSVQRIAEPFPVPFERNFIKTIPIDRPIPQPFPVVKHVAQPYPVPVEHNVIKEIQIPQPFPVIKETIKHVPVERLIPQVNIYL